jgi:preprotein translocase subunit SecA
MLGFLSKMFGGSKSEKDIKLILPIVDQINKFSAACQSLSNDQLRNKTQEFKNRIKAHLQKIDDEIADLNKQADELPFSDIVGKDALYQQVDALIKDRDKQIEEVLKEIQPEAFAVVKETARRFKENTEIVATATDLDHDLSVKKEYITIQGNHLFSKTAGMPAAASLPGTWSTMMFSLLVVPYCIRVKFQKWPPVKVKRLFLPCRLT